MNTILIAGHHDSGGWPVNLILLVAGVCLLLMVYTSIDTPLLRRMSKFSLRTLFAAQTLIVIAIVTLRAMGFDGGSMFCALLILGGIAVFWFVLYSIVTIWLQDLFMVKSDPETRNQQLPDKVVITTPIQDNPPGTTEVNFGFLADANLCGKAATREPRVIEVGQRISNQSAVAKCAGRPTANIHPT